VVSSPNPRATGIFAPVMLLHADPLGVHTALGDEGDIHPRSSYPPRAVTKVRSRLRCPVVHRVPHPC
jgi:hypothetical protein